MLKIVLGALALTAATTPTLANSWSTTDRDLANLSSSLTQNASGVSVSGFLRSSYVSWTDVDPDNNATTANSGDIGAFSIDDAQIWVTGSVGDFSVTIQADAASTSEGLFMDRTKLTGVGAFTTDGAKDVTAGTNELIAYGGNNTPFSVGSLGSLGLLDAYVAWNATEMIKVQMGQFRPAFLASSALNENNMLFINRSRLGAAGAYRSQGLQASASFGMFNIAVFAQNGEEVAVGSPAVTGVAENDLSYGARASAQIMGTSSSTEGALGASNDPSLVVGIGFIDDAAQISWLGRTVGGTNTYSNNVGECLAFDTTFTMGALSLSAELVDITGSGDAATDSPDATPFSAAGSFMVIPDQLELAIRYEDFDDRDETSWMTYGVNWYLQGHAAKWQINYIDGASDEKFLDSDMVQLGLTVSM